MHKVALALGIVLAGIARPLFADAGRLALRIACPYESEVVEFEPFIAWNGGNPPYKEYGIAEADSASARLFGRNWFYSYGFQERNFIATSCNTKSRAIRVFVTDQRELTVTEAGSVVVDAMPMGDTWDNWDVIYFLRSTKVGKWEECYGPKAAGYGKLTCSKFDPSKPKSRIMSNKSLNKHAPEDGAPVS